MISQKVVNRMEDNKEIPEKEVVEQRVTPKAPLPAKVEDFIAKRKISSAKTINDTVEELHLSLYNDKDLGQIYRDFLNAVYDEEAIEGSQDADDLEAARMIRTLAKERNMPMISNKKLTTIVKALNVGLRRYTESRAQRRNMLHGEIVETDNKSDEAA